MSTPFDEEADRITGQQTASRPASPILPAGISANLAKCLPSLDLSQQHRHFSAAYLEREAQRRHDNSPRSIPQKPSSGSGRLRGGGPRVIPSTVNVIVGATSR